MAFRLLIEQDALYPESSLLASVPLNVFDTIGDDDWSHDRDEMLAARSAFELVREQMTDAQRAELDRVDAYWRDHAQAFNESFKLDHAFADRKRALEGWIEDEHGEVPEVPAAHWWWKPIEEPAK